MVYHDYRYSLVSICDGYCGDIDSEIFQIVIMGRFVWYFLSKKYPKRFRGEKPCLPAGRSLLAEFKKILYSSRSNSLSPKNLFLFSFFIPFFYVSTFSRTVCHAFFLDDRMVFRRTNFSAHRYRRYGVVIELWSYRSFFIIYLSSRCSCSRVSLCHSLVGEAGITYYCETQET